MANRNSNEEFDRLLQQAQTNRGSQPLDVSGGTPLQSDSYLKDNFQVEQRKLRTLHITSILQYYKLKKRLNAFFALITVRSFPVSPSSVSSVAIIRLNVSSLDKKILHITPELIAFR